MDFSIQKINGDFKGKDILSFDQFSQSDLSLLFSKVPAMKKLIEEKKASSLLAGLTTALCFVEPSSRTFSSFATAMKRLGGTTIELLNPEQTSSMVKGETLEDTIRTLEAYADAIVIRHRMVGTAQIAAEAAKDIPVINAGDGNSEHPTQALLDLYTIFERFHTIDGIRGLFVGDIVNSRTIHSLLRGLSLYKKVTVYLLAPQELQLTTADQERFTKRGVTLKLIQSDEEIPQDLNFWYWTRVQKERFSSMETYERVKNKFVLTPDVLLAHGNKDMIIMHPLPRVGEIAPAIDDDHRAVYLRSQIRNGLYIRMALFQLLFGRV